MRIYLICMECQRLELDNRSKLYPAELQDSGLYNLRCCEQHEMSVKLKNPKFEVLLELGLNAIHDGYYREAISSFTSSLERFYEYVINILFKVNDINKEEFSLLWKNVSNQSERQFGAYLFIYKFVEGVIPPLLPNSKIKLRNEVIHKGKIPTRAEAMEFGFAILEAIVPVLSVIVQKYDKEILSLMLEELDKLDKKIVNGRLKSTHSISTPISALNGNYELPNLEDNLAYISIVRKNLN